MWVFVFIREIKILSEKEGLLKVEELKLWKFYLI